MQKSIHNTLYQETFCTCIFERPVNSKSSKQSSLERSQEITKSPVILEHFSASKLSSSVCVVKGPTEPQSFSGTGVVGGIVVISGTVGGADVVSGVVGDPDVVSGVVGRADVVPGVVGDADVVSGVVGDADVVSGVVPSSVSISGVVGASVVASGVVGFAVVGDSVVGLNVHLGSSAPLPPVPLSRYSSASTASPTRRR